MFKAVSTSPKVTCRIGVVHSVVNKAFARPVPNPVEVIFAFSELAPKITVSEPPTSRAPFRSKSFKKKYVVSAAKVITPETAAGKSNIVETKTKLFNESILPAASSFHSPTWLTNS